jgi:hypothetical protein
MHIKETNLNPDRILTSDAEPSVRIERTEQFDGAVRYTVSSGVILEREAIAAIASSPIGQHPAPWEDVMAGFKAITYPSRRVRRQEKMAKKLLDRFSLKDVQPATRELAHVLERNQDYRETRVNISVLTSYQEARAYVLELIETLPRHRFAAILKSFEDNPLVFTELSRIVESRDMSLEEIGLHVVTGIDEAESQRIEQRAIFDISGPQAQLDMEQYMLEGELYQTGQPAQFDGLLLSGGSRQGGVYVRQDDVPDHLTKGGVLKQNVDMFVGGQLRDSDKATGLNRYQVSFREQSVRFVATPELVWETREYDDGSKRRQFIFDTHAPEYSIFSGTVRQRSCLAGAALFAAANAETIDYAKALRRITPRNHHFGRGSAGLWPLVARFKENDLLDHPYVEMVENQSHESPSWQDIL